MSFVLFQLIGRFLDLLPISWLYVIAEFIALLLHRVFRYRYKVVKSNLQVCFPQWSRKEIHNTIKEYYKHLSRIIMESFMVGRLNSNTINNHYSAEGVEPIKELLGAGRSVVFATAHFGNWEWGAAGCPFHMYPYPCVVFYKPIANKKIENYMVKIRASQGCEIVSIKDTAKCFEERKDIPTIYFMIADQSPSNIDKAIWVNFFGKNTASLHGPAHYAQLYDMPIFFGAVYSIAQSKYHIKIDELTKTPNNMNTTEITQRYYNMLESAIIQQPHNWIWSHKRWKHTLIDS